MISSRILCKNCLRLPILILEFLKEVIYEVKNGFFFSETIIKQNNVNAEYLLRTRYNTSLNIRKYGLRKQIV